PHPHLLLLDEPFSNLDVELRERLSLEVREIIKASGTTAILVTHDQHEAFAVADVVGIMHRGRIEQWDTPYDLYHRPATRCCWPPESSCGNLPPWPPRPTMSSSSATRRRPARADFSFRPKAMLSPTERCGNSA
ncbi:MAG: iron(III) transport system ATP-binding protein, partial [Acidimicrobiaceae bacterium]